MRNRGPRSSNSNTTARGQVSGKLRARVLDESPVKVPPAVAAISASDLMPVEPRYVFDGAGMATLAAMANEAQQPDQVEKAPDQAPTGDKVAPPAEAPADAQGDFPERSPLAARTAPYTIVFVDSRVGDQETLLADLPADAEIIVLDAESDALEQMREVLEGLGRRADALHIVSHGEAGELQVGSGGLDSKGLEARAATLAAIGDMLNPNADILLYGCDVGAGDAGREFVETLAALTGADVAASDDDTGSAALGGDWDLEATVGSVEATGIYAPDYDGLLAPLTITPAGTGGVNATVLAQELLGSNVTVTSATLYGQAFQAGTFSGATGYSPEWLAFDSGVVFSSGSAAGLPTSNTSDGYSAGITSLTGGQADFGTIGGNASYNASYIDISFIPDNDRIAIQFVFGSDEYNEYVYGAFSDAIAIWVNGTNIAVTPTGEAISIDTINQAGSFAPDFGSQANDPNPTNGVYDSAAASLFVNNDLQNGGGSIPIEMDGFTRTLGANITVTPGVVNTIRLGVSDIGDGALDSWLLVKADSVQANLIAQNDVVGTTINTAVTFDVLANDIDFDGDAKTIVNIADQPITVGQTVNLASGATVLLNADGTLTVTPASGSTLPELFTYTITDGNGNTATAYATVNIVAGTPPTLDLDASAAGTGFATTYTVGGGGIAIADVDATVSDTNNIARATIGLGGSFAGDQLSVGTLPAGVSIDPSSTATSIVLVGNVTPATMADAIKAVTFSNSNGSPDLSDRMISVQVTDATGLSSAIAQTTISLAVPNAAPVGVDDNIPVTEDTPVTQNVLPNDTDVEGDPLTISAAEIDTNGDGAPDALTLGTPTPITDNGGNPVGTITVAANGDITFDPAPDYTGPVPDLTYTPNDGTEDGTPATVTFGPIIPVNDPPVGVDDNIPVTEDTPVTQNVLGNDTDVEGDPLTISSAEIDTNGDGTPDALVLGTPTPITDVGGNPVGTITVDANGDITFDPAPDYTGPVPDLTYTPNDGTEDGSPATVTFGPIVPVNDPPVGVDDNIPVTEDTPVTQNVLPNDTDVEGDPLTISSAEIDTNGDGTPDALALGTPTPITDVGGNPVGTITVAANGDITFDPAPDYTGPLPDLTYTPNDGTEDGTPATVTFGPIVPVNDPPVGVDDTIPVTEDTPVTQNVLPNDPDVEGDPLTISSAGIDTNGDGTPDALTLGTPTPITDVGGNPVGTITVAANGDITFDPAPDYTGPVPDLTYTPNDGTEDGTPATVTFGPIIPVNDPPVGVDDNIPVTEDTPVTQNVLGNDTDVEGDPLTISAAEIDTNGDGTPDALVLGTPTPITDVGGNPVGTITVAANGDITFDPAPDYTGPLPDLTYTPNDGTEDGTPATVTFGPIVPVNDDPLAQGDGGSTDENTVLSVAAGSGGLLDNDSDNDGDTLAVSAIDGLAYAPGTLVTLPSGALLTVNADGSYAYDPNGAFEGLAVGDSAQDSFTYTIDDGNGGTDMATVTIDIAGVNDAPVAADDSGTTDEDTPLTVAAGSGGLLDNDSDADTSDTLSIAAVDGTPYVPGTQVTLASGALLTIFPDGSYSYDPNGAFENLAGGAAGTDTFTYTIDDGNGGTDTATVTINVTGVNDAPVAQDDAETTDEDTSFAGNVLSDNGNGPDADAEGDVLTVTEVNGAAFGSGTPITLASGALLVMNSDGTYSYDPNGAFEGLAAGESAQDSFTYTIDDGNGGTDMATVIIDIAGVNDAPVAADDGSATNEDSPLLVVAGSGGLLDNDSDADTSDTLSIAAVDGTPYVPGTQVTLPSGALLTIFSDGSYAYDPNSRFEGLAAGESAQDSFTYTIDDGNGGTDVATVTIDIAGVNDAPVIVDPNNPQPDPANPDPASDPNTVIPVQVVSDGEDYSATPLVDIDDYVIDPDTSDDPNLTFTTSDPLPAGLTLNPDGTVTGMVDPSASQGGPNGDGIYPVTVTIDDGTTTTTVQLTIDVSNLPPVAVDDAGNASEDGPAVTGNVITDPATGDADTAPDSDPLTVTLADQAGTPITIGTPFATAGGGMLTLNADGSYSFDPGTAYNGLDDGESAIETITYTVDDGNGGTDSATLTITVQGQNDAPVIVDPANPGTPDNPIPADPNTIIPVQTPNDGDDFTTTPLVDIDDYVIDPDTSDDPNLTFTTSDPLPAGLTLNPDGTVTGMVDPSASQGGPNGDGTYPVTVTIDDGTTTTTVQLTIDVSNLPPVAVDDAGNASEDEVQKGNLVSNDIDGDGDPLQVTHVNGVPAGTPVPLTYGTLTVEPGGSYIFTPNETANSLAGDMSVVEQVTYTVDDGNGGTDSATLTITVQGQNDAPVIVDPDNPAVPPADPANVLEDAEVADGDDVMLPTGAVFADPDGEPLTFSATGLPPGLTIDPATGDISGTLPPDAPQGGPYQVTVTGTDPSGASVSTVLMINIGNPPPVAEPDTAAAVQGQPVTIPVLVNDSDPDGDPVEVISASSPQGEVTVNPDGTLTFVPGPEAVGTAEITYTISDGNGGLATATVTVSVDPAPEVDPVHFHDTAQDVPDGGDDSAPLFESDGGRQLHVDKAANQGGSLDSIDGGDDEPGLDVDGPLLTQAVNGVESLNGLGTVGPDDDSSVDDIRRLNGRAFGDSTVSDPSRFDPAPHGFSTGYTMSVEIGSTASAGMAHFELFSRASQHHVHVGLLERAGAGGSKVEGISVTLPGGAPLPSWINASRDGLIVIDKQASQAIIRLEVAIDLGGDGIVYRTIEVNGQTGEILSVSEPKQVRQGLMFEEQLEQFARTPDALAQRMASAKVYA